jgi:hypothetical protein
VVKDDLLPEKGSIIREMFLHTADENYIVARWSYDNHLMTDFFWNSVHALEKYMKAVLLFNGISVKVFSHGLEELYNEIENLAGALLPTTLVQPADLDIYNWVDLTPRQFIEKLDRNGNADNRYLTYGYAQHPWYLHMVDASVWAIRRLAVPLDMPIAAGRKAGLPTHRAVLSKQPCYAPSQMLALDKLISAEDSEARRALLNNNCAFAPDNYPHEARRQGTSGRNPILLRRIIDPLKSERADNARHGFQMGRWLLANTKQSKPVRQEVEDAMKTALLKHPEIDQP